MGRFNADGIFREFMTKGKFEEVNHAEREMIIRNMYTRVLLELATNRFQWHNLPDSVNMRFLELTLATKGMSIFYHDKDYGKFMALRGGTHMMPNIMDEPTFLRTAGQGVYRAKTLKAVQMGETITGEAVPIWSNYLRSPDWDIISIYAHKLARLDTTIEINLGNARRTRVIAANPDQRMTMENINRQIDEGVPALKISDPELLNQLAAIDLGIDPNSHEKLHVLRVRLWNECMGLLGINNANQDKKERLVVDEVNANDEQVDTTQAINLNARRQACDVINKRWPELLMNENGPISVTIGGVAPSGVPAPFGGVEDAEGIENNE